MVQRLTYRTRHSYATKSNQTRVVKTPGKHLISAPLSIKLGFIFIFSDCNPTLISSILLFGSAYHWVLTCWLVSKSHLAMLVMSILVSRVYSFQGLNP